MQPKQPTIADILNDLPKIRQIANSPLAANPLLGVVLQQAQALGQIAQWTMDAEAVVAAQPGNDLTPTEATNGYAEMPAEGELVEVTGGQRGAPG